MELGVLFYVLIALAVFVTMLPVLYDETRRAFDENETHRDRIAAVLWIVAIILMCVGWLAFLLLWWLTAPSIKDKKNLRESDELYRDGY